MKNSEEPAYPTQDSKGNICLGLNKRELIAKDILAGILASRTEVSVKDIHDKYSNLYTDLALSLTDELLTKLEQKS